MQRELNVLALIKGEERYVFVYDDQCQAELIDKFRQWASDPDISFTWFDAAVMSHQLGQHLAKELKAFLPKKAA